jgi:hypothetical protein
MYAKWIMTTKAALLQTEPKNNQSTANSKVCRPPSVLAGGKHGRKYLPKKVTFTAITEGVERTKPEFFNRN